MRRRFQKRRIWTAINRQSWLLVLIGVVLLSVVRYALFFTQSPDGISLSKDMLWQGLRFDGRMMAIILAPNILICSLLMLLPERFIRTWRVAWLAWAFLGLCVVLWLSFTNLYFFKAYQTSISPLLFNPFSDGFQELLKRTWTSPVFVPMLLSIIIISSAIITPLYRAARRPIKRRPKWLNRLTLIMSIGLLLLIGRGNLGVFPMRKYYRVALPVDVWLAQSTPIPYVTVSKKTA